MKIYAPSYYKDFACIADRCKHSCCIGWEIDVDEDTYMYYKEIGGAFGTRLLGNIESDAQSAHFCLDKDERCPFLNRQGLCDIITTLGEDALCQICADHPRFRNFYADRTEIGLGLCCEAAAELILNFPEKMTVELIEDDGIVEEKDEDEATFFSFRARVLSVVQNREKTLAARMEDLCAFCGLKEDQVDLDTWRPVYLKLERLDDAWTQVLSAARKNAYMPTDLQREQLLCYFIYRHTADGIYDGSLQARLQFCLHAAALICALSTDASSFLDIARMYSAEIEYSEENIKKLLSQM